MRRNLYGWAGISGLLVWALSLAGCGGGGGGGDGGQVPGSPISVNIQGARWVAFQDGTSSGWQVVSASGGFNGTLRVAAADGRYSIAYVCGEAKPTVNVVHTSVSEAPQLSARCGSGVSNAVTVRGSVQGLNGGQALIGIGEATQLTTGSYELSVQPPGTYDVVAVRLINGVPNRVWLQRNRTFSSNTTYNINFNQTDGAIVRVFDVGSGNVGVTNLDVGANEVATVQVFLQSAARASVIGVGGLAPNLSSVNYPLIPNNLLSAGESFRVRIITTEARGIDQVLSSLPSNLSYTLPAPLVEPSFSVSNLGAVTVSVVGLSYTESDVRGYLLELGGDSQPVRYQVLISASWLGDATSYTSPAFANLPGWNANWSLQRGVPLSASLRVLVAPSTVNPTSIWAALQGANPPAGFLLRYATRQQVLSP